jgi:hypothetical protein
MGNPERIRMLNAYAWSDEENDFHREDGPAVMYDTGSVSWYVHGIPCCSNKEYQQATGLSDEDMLILILKYGNVE